MFLKLTGSVCVLVACVGFVREILRTGNLHRKMLESLIEMTELLAAEIRYERLPIQDALLQVQKKVRPEISIVLLHIVEQMKKGSGTEFVTIWEQAFREVQKDLFLKSEELDEVCRIGKHLGFLDQTQQEQHLKGCAKRLQRMQEQVQKELEEKKRIYRYLGMAAGIFVILVLV